MKIGIIGGGIIGLSSAYYLQKAGCDVTVIDQGDLTDGCSHGNAGMIVPSHIIPLAAPGMISKGIRWMFNATSPFYVRPRLNGDFIKWGYHFYRSATHDHVKRSIPVLKEISLLSKEMYKQWAESLPFNFGFQQRGLLMLFRTKEAGAEESETAHLANQHGIEAHMLTAAEAQKLEPNVRLDVLGGIYFPGDSHLVPHLLMKNLEDYLRAKGVKFQLHTQVHDFVVSEKSVRVIRTNKGEFVSDQIVLAGGAWSGALCSKLQVSVPMQAGKGYSFMLNDASDKIRIPSILLEARVAVTPMGDSIRFGGTMEITGTDHSISMNRVQGIVRSIPSYYPEIKPGVPPKETIWHGLRPCSPDGLPYLGRLKNATNVLVATGHAMMGLSLGAGTGKLVSEMAMGVKTSMDLRPFDPARFD